MKQFYIKTMVLCFLPLWSINTFAQTTNLGESKILSNNNYSELDDCIIGFENQALNEQNFWIGTPSEGTPVESTWDPNWICTYTEKSMTFKSTYSEYNGFGYWTGFAISGRTENNYENITTDQYNSVPGGAYCGNKFLVVQNAYNDYECITFDKPRQVLYMYCTNSAYAYSVMTKGDAFAGEPFTADDWFSGYISCYNEQGDIISCTEVQLAKNGVEANSKYIEDWQKVNINAKNVKKISFSFDGSRKGEWGLNIPAYMCVDNLCIGYSDGDLLYDTTEEGIEIAYTIISAKDKTCRVGNNALRSDINGHVTIPEIVNGFTVVEIGHEAFEHCSGLTGITIPNSVKKINTEAFYKCTNLSSIVIPDSVKTIRHGAFSNCISLANVTIGSGVDTIEEDVFEECSSLTSITIPNNVISIGKDAFYGCDNLKDVSIDCSSISDCFRKSKIETLVIGKHTEIIRDSAFYECSQLKKVTMGSGIKSVGFDAFLGCNNIKEVHVDDLAAWCNIDFETKKYNQYYTNYNISYYSNPLSPFLTGSAIFTGDIGRPLFCNGEEVTDLVIPDGVKIIKPYVFPYGYYKSVTLPATIESMKKAFYKCWKIEEVHIFDLAAWCNIDFGTENSENEPCNSLLSKAQSLYINGKKITSLQIPTTVKTIKPYAFQGCPIESVVLPNGLKSINEGAFKDCKELNSIVIPNTVTSIGKNAFADCMNLYSVTSLINMPFNLDETVFQYTGTQYDKDIIYMAAKLYVPIGRTAMYSNVQGWKKFMSIMETDTKFKLTYMIDGEVYKTYEIQAAEVITPEPDPYKEGYIFSGWSNIPYLMPAQDVTVTGSFTIDPEYQVSVDILKKEDTVPEAYYSPEGRRLDAPQRGINIIKMSNGTTKKVVVK